MFTAAAGQDPLDQPDVDHLGVQGTPARVVDLLGAVAAHQPQQPVDLTHLGPRQRMLEHRCRVGADMGALGGCLALQGIQITHRIDRDLRGKIGRISMAATRGHDRMHLDQLTTPIELDRVCISTGLDALADQLSGHAVEGFGDLDVAVRGHFRARPDRNVEGGVGYGP